MSIEDGNTESACQIGREIAEIVRRGEVVGRPDLLDEKITRFTEAGCETPADALAYLVYAAVMFGEAYDAALSDAPSEDNFSAASKFMQEVVVYLCRETGLDVWTFFANPEPLN